MLLYLLSTFHITFIKINLLFSKLLFLLCLALAVLITFIFKPLWNLNFTGVQSQKKKKKMQKKRKKVQKCSLKVQSYKVKYVTKLQHKFLGA